MLVEVDLVEIRKHPLMKRVFCFSMSVKKSEFFPWFFHVCLFAHLFLVGKNKRRNEGYRKIIKSRKSNVRPGIELVYKVYATGS